MNSVLLKAFLDEKAKEGTQLEAARMAEELENRYRDAVERAYTLKSADEFIKEGSFKRTGDVIASNILGIIPGTVAEGRADLAKSAWEPTFMQFLRHQGVRDALQGAREGEIQMPDFSDPVSVMTFWENIRPILGTQQPRSRAREQKRTERIQNSVASEEPATLFEKYYGKKYNE